MAVVFVVAGVGLLIRYVFVTSADEAATASAPRISDVAFEQGATAVCKRYIDVFDTATTLVHLASKEQTGDFLESIARSFDQMVVSLRAVPIAAIPGDRAPIEQWLADWEAYDAYGHRYAAAVRVGGERDLVAHDKTTIDGLLRRRNGFARANHLSACAFH